MQFLGRLGIDFHLVVAQIVNFGILTFILFKFVYKPIYKKIEEDEAKLKEAEVKTEELNSKEKSLEEEEKKKREELDEKTQKMIADAEEIAKNLKARTLQKAEERASEILSQAQSEAESTPNLKIKLNEKGLAGIFKSKETYAKLESEFFDKLMSQIKDELLKYPEIDEFTLETAHPLDRKSKKEFEGFIKRYVGEDKKIKIKNNEKLIIGYRLITDKVSIDQNLLFEIAEATNAV